uniref:Uncharacterized protein n=1 Tax=Nicotiana tabacum TaxID=4097 RepID=A0A1S4BLF7_TOBAC|nr:PREDICTED: uncharacterized protein LOC107809576 [Nicotiana tabacum]
MGCLKLKNNSLGLVLTEILVPIPIGVDESTELTEIRIQAAQEEINKEKEVAKEAEEVREKSSEKVPEQDRTQVTGKKRPPAPFPRRLAKYQKDEQYKKFMNMLKDIQVNIQVAQLCKNDEGLDVSQVEQLLQVLKECKTAIGWTIADIKGIVLGHLVSSKSIEVNRAKVDEIEKLPPPTSVKAIRGFLGHASFYRRFIKDFSKIANPLCKLLEKDHPFVFSDNCMVVFEELKKKLVIAPIIVALD